MWGRGPACSSGYYNDPEATWQSWTSDGWFKTGDQGKFDEQSNLVIVGRNKDIIIRGGENIAARDVEDLISSHPEVEYVAAIGIPDPEFGEQVCVFVKRVKESDIQGQDILDHLENLEASKILYPSRCEFVEAIPLTAAGKADKKVLTKVIEEKLKSEMK